MAKGFQPGNKLSLGKGRPRGSRRKNEDLQKKVTDFLLGNMADLQKEYDRNMSTGQKIKCKEILMPFVIPKLMATAIQNTYQTLDDQTLELMVDRLKQKVLKESNPIKIKANEKEPRRSDPDTGVSR